MRRMPITLATVLLCGILTACGTSGATPAQTAQATTAQPSSSPAPSEPAASATAEPGALPSPDLVFKAEDCAADAWCRRVAVARVSRIAFTPAVPCKADGTTCELVLDLYYPNEPPAEGHPYPVVVFEPGGPDAPGTSGSPLVTILAGQGVVVIDGSWRQGEAWGGGGTIGAQDIACTIRAARALAPMVGGAPERVTLVGHSLGGYGGAIVAFSPDLKPDPEQCLHTEGRSVPDAFAGLAGVYDDAVDLVAEHGAPIFPVVLLHGDPDGVVPLAESQSLAAALTKAGLPTEVVIEPGVDHYHIWDAPATFKALVELVGAG